jgi:hypothetical protein
MKAKQRLWCKLENQSRWKKKVAGTEDGHGYEDGGNV